MKQQSVIFMHLLIVIGVLGFALPRAHAATTTYVGEYYGEVGHFGKDYQYTMIHDPSDHDPTPGTGWQQASFDHSAWSVGESPFANVSGEANSSFTGYNVFWPEFHDVYVWKTFELANPINMTAYTAVDNGYGLWINGTHIHSAQSGGYGYWWEYTRNINASHFVTGTNTIAIHLDDYGGGTAWDFALRGDEAAIPPPAPAVPGPLAALAGCIWVSSLILHRRLKVHKLNSEL